MQGKLILDESYVKGYQEGYKKAIKDIQEQLKNDYDIELKIHIEYENKETGGTKNDK